MIKGGSRRIPYPEVSGTDPLFRCFHGHEIGYKSRSGANRCGRKLASRAISGALSLVGEEVGKERKEGAKTTDDDETINVFYVRE